MIIGQLAANASTAALRAVARDRLRDHSPAVRSHGSGGYEDRRGELLHEGKHAFAAPLAWRLPHLADP